MKLRCGWLAVTACDKTKGPERSLEPLGSVSVLFVWLISSVTIPMRRRVLCRWL